MPEITLDLGAVVSPGTPEDRLPMRVPLAKLPHLLIAGMTGSGKSAVIHNLLCQLISYRDFEVGLVLIDPKRIELSRYAGLPHVIAEPVYDIGRTKTFLEWTVNEMELRFEAMRKSAARDIDEHNETAAGKRWSRLIVVIDELANLILADRAIERPIVAIASMGRAAGIHMILATQRPSTDVVTGLIKANVPTRLCLPVVTQMESRIILDAPGAEKLERPGEILARLPGFRSLLRLDSPYLEEAEIDRAVSMARVVGSDSYENTP